MDDDAAAAADIRLIGHERPRECGASQTAGPAVDHGQSGTPSGQRGRGGARRRAGDRSQQSNECKPLEYSAWLRGTEDYKEGVRSVSERRVGNFVGR